MPTTEEQCEHAENEPAQGEEEDAAMAPRPLVQSVAARQETATVPVELAIEASAPSAGTLAIEAPAGADQRAVPLQLLDDGGRKRVVNCDPDIYWIHRRRQSLGQRRDEEGIQPKASRRPDEGERAGGRREGLGEIQIPHQAVRAH
jgi:hypothetical protein